MSVRTLALALAVVLIVPAAAAIWRLEWLAAGATRSPLPRRERRLDLVYAAVPVALLAALVAFAVVD